MNEVCTDSPTPKPELNLPYPHAPKHTRRLPTIFDTGRVSRLIDSARNLFHYAMLLIMYSAGLRRSELCKLKVSNIDSGRMVIRMERGKSGVDCEVPLNPKPLTTLREYWRWMRPKTYLVPWYQQLLARGQTDHTQGDLGSRATGCTEGRNPETRHTSYAPALLRTHVLEEGADLRTIQVWMGHKDIEATTRYLHVYPKRLQAATNPLERISVSGPARLQRSRKLHKPE